MPQDIDDIKSFDVSLQYLTHDARTVVDGVGLFDLKLYDQMCLMVWCYNYNSSRVLTSLKKHKGHDHIVSRTIILEAANNERRFFGTPKYQASFSFNAIRNLYLVDRSILYADYNAKLDILANTLNQLKRESITAFAVEVGRMNMELVLFRLQDRVAAKNQFRKEMNVPNQKVDRGQAMSEEGREKLKGLLKDIRDMREQKERGEKGE